MKLGSQFFKRGANLIGFVIKFLQGYTSVTDRFGHDIAIHGSLAATVGA